MVDSTLIISGILAAGSIGALLVSFYRWVYLPHVTNRETKQRDVFQPIVRTLEATVKTVGEFHKAACENLVLLDQAPWMSKIEQVQQELREQLNEAAKLLKEYCDWLRASRDAVAFKIFEACMIHPEFPQEFDQLGLGHLRDRVLNLTHVPMLKGKRMTRSHFQDSDHQFWDAVMGCKSRSWFDEMIAKLDEMHSYSSMENARRAKDSFVDFATKLIAHIKDRYLVNYREPISGGQGALQDE